VASFFDDLRATRDDPAGTWFTLLKHAGFPQAEKLLKALPSVLADRLYGWINETLAAQFQPGQAKRAELDGIIDEASALLARFDVLTTLNVPAAEMGTPASHTFAGFGFKLLELNVTVPVPRFVVNRQGPFVLETLTGVTFTQATEPALVFSDHAFGLPWGEYAWAAINIRQRQRGGIDLRSHIGRLFDCPGFAAWVSSAWVTKANCKRSAKKAWIRWLSQ